MEIQERIKNLLNSELQKAPNVFVGKIEQSGFDICNAGVGIMLSPFVQGIISKRIVTIYLRPSKQFKFALAMMLSVNIVFFIGLILDFQSGWYFLFLLFVHFLIVNLEGLKNYNKILEVLELSDKKITKSNFI
ncbi:hypothetical protein [Chondrinema litorale]|uniref:hypothetical protein n=1 Tax=Chondrinema litorale TaxID=2994555 RepID=UPI0025438D16|nr:hypothetical protein [Chondrinema litorale]UZR99181.1 hypothetical protein OQ292_34810 [Chondrinema litorale]